MSNCVNIYNDAVIPTAHIDVERLFKDIDRVNALTKEPDAAGDNWKDNYIWWFMGRKNFWVEGDKLIIRWGGHRSGHTWRDLRGCCWVLADYLTYELNDDQQYAMPLMMSDEFDGHKERFRHNMIIRTWEEHNKSEDKGY